MAPPHRGRAARTPPDTPRRVRTSSLLNPARHPLARSHFLRPATGVTENAQFACVPGCSYGGTITTAIVFKTSQLDANKEPKPGEVPRMVKIPALHAECFGGSRLSREIARDDTITFEVNGCLVPGWPGPVPIVRFAVPATAAPAAAQSAAAATSGRAASTPKRRRQPEAAPREQEHGARHSSRGRGKRVAIPIKAASKALDEVTRAL